MKLKINNIWSLPVDPFIIHMRISYEENIRKSTESYWRDKIASEFYDMPEVAEKIKNNKTY